MFKFPGLQGTVAIMCGMDYPSSLSDKQWKLIQKVLPPANHLGRKQIDRRRIVSAILYVCRTGCQWRLLPKDFPHWNTVYGVFRQWKLNGVWLKIHDALRDKVRKAAGKKASPTAGIIDSQSIRTAEGGDAKGYDGGMKITGRKRHILVDTLELLLMVVVHRADIQDYEGGGILMNGIHGIYKKLKKAPMEKEGFPRSSKRKNNCTFKQCYDPRMHKGFKSFPKDEWSSVHSLGTIDAGGCAKTTSDLPTHAKAWFTFP